MGTLAKIVSLIFEGKKHIVVENNLKKSNFTMIMFIFKIHLIHQIHYKFTRKCWKIMILFGREFLYTKLFHLKEKQKAFEFQLMISLSNCLLLSSAKPIVNKKEVKGMLFVFISTIFQESSFLLS